MIAQIDPKVTERPIVRCADCDRETEHYNIFVSPINEERYVCWECMQRDDKGFFAKRTFKRSSRGGVIPR
jgi:hypothetical protein